MLNFLIMIIPNKIIQQFGSRIPNDPEDSNHPVDDRAGIVGNHHLIGSRTNSLRDNLSNNKHEESCSNNGQPIGHETMDDEGQRFKGHCVGDQQSHQEQVVVVHHRKDPLGLLLFHLVALVLHHV